MQQAQPAAGARPLPLRGRRIVVTRAIAQAPDLAERIRAWGGEPVEFPTIEVALLADYAALDEALARAASFAWVVFTSVNGVRAAAARLGAPAAIARALGSARLAAIGPATARELEALGLAVAFMPAQFRGEQLALALPVAPGDRVVLFRADIASEDLHLGLEARGVAVTNVVAYRTVRPAARRIDLTAVDAITFTSSSTARNFVEMLDPASRAALNRPAIFCIGPVTAATARALGLPVAAVAEEYTVPGLVSAICNYYAGREEQAHVDSTD